ncbi:MAG: hypothetical protein GC159_06950 [Phycisphaera sp.]|nr:hypothetical protein [Phycisphaera sp.]
MAEGLGRERWAHTSLICALIANTHRDPKKQKPVKPDDFNPYVAPTERAEVIEVTPDTIALMRQAFAPGGAGHREQNTSSERTHP